MAQLFLKNLAGGSSSTGGTSDHGLLVGLDDNDHPQYRLTADTIYYSGLGSTSHTHSQYALQTEFLAHTGNSSIHFTEASINIANITSAHTHTESEISDLKGYALDTRVDDIEIRVDLLDIHTANTTVHFTEASIDHGSISGLLDNDHPQYRLTADTIYFSGLGSTSHTHTLADISDSAHTHDYVSENTSVQFSSLSATGQIYSGGTNLSEIFSGSAGVSVLNDLGDVDTSGVLNGQVLTYTGGTWTAQTSAAGVTDHGLLDGLLDNDHPQYRLTADTIYYSGIGSTSHTHTLANITDSAHTHVVADITDFDPTNYTTDTEFATHTGDSTIHFTVDSIEYSAISQTAHTHVHNTDLTGLQGGTSGEYYHLDLTEYISTSGTSYAKKDPTGFVNTNTDSTLSFDTGTRTLTISPTGSTYDVMIDGKLYQPTGNSVTIADEQGLHHIVYSADGSLVSLGTGGTIEDFIFNNAYVCNVYWDADDNVEVNVGDERHGAGMASETHEYLHRTQGTRYISGLALEGITAGEDGSSDQHAVVGCGSGIILDEDLQLNLSQVATGATIPVLWKSGTTYVWKREAPRIHPVMTGGTGRVVYNNINGGDWTTTEVTSNNYVLYHFFATNDITYPIFSVMGEAEYSNISDARAGAANEIGSISTAGVPFQEFVEIGTVIFNTRNLYSNQSKAAIVLTDDGNEYVDFRFSNITSVSSVSDHGSLAGLSDDDHTQYHNNARADAWLSGKTHTTFSASSLFSGSTNVSSLISARTLQTHFEAHTGDSTIHFTEASIDHTAIQNIGTNTHAQIDSHIADGTIHFTEASIDHGAIAGLLDNDHPQYTLSGSFVSHTGNTSNPHQTSLANLVSSSHTHDYHTDLTNTGHNHTLANISDSAHTHTEAQISDLGDYAERTYFESHTGNTSNPHSTSLANLVSSGHTHDYHTDLTNTGHNHVVAEITDFNPDDYTTDIEFDAHTGTSNIHFTEASIDHGSISGLLDNDHPQYLLSGYFATHTGDSTIHFTEASIDHGSIGGLLDNDHPQYALSGNFETHTGDSTIHFTVASIDHGSISGLGDNDHTQYALTGSSNPYSLSGDSISAASQIYSGGVDIATLMGGASPAYIDSKAITLRDTQPDENVTLMVAHQSITLISAMTLVMGSSPSADWKVMSGTSRASGTQVYSAQTTSSSTTEYDTISQTIDSNAILWIETTATGGTSVSELHITLNYSGT